MEVIRDVGTDREMRRYVCHGPGGERPAEKPVISRSAVTGSADLELPETTDEKTRDGRPNTVCLVTIHGIGFQQAPDDVAGLAGYADPLHALLHDELQDLLSDDPHRAAPGRVPGERGVIYVQSSWPADETDPGQRSVEKGLERLGSRTDRSDATLDITGKPLFAGSARIAHVALIYTPLEETRPDRVALLETATLGLFHLENYSSLHHELAALGQDIMAIIRAPRVAGEPALGNIPRRDFVHREGMRRRLLEHFHGGPPSVQPPGPFEVLRDIEDDVAGYVARNELRERSRDFVREALIRLSQRADVGRIVVNAHSQGSVLAFDTLRTLPSEAIDRVAAFFTLGTLLRKSVDWFSWGQDVGQLRRLQNWEYGEQLNWGREVSPVSIPAWTNLWDKLDPVADPLVPSIGWTRDQPLVPPPSAGLFKDVNQQTGAETPHPLEDFVVNNVDNVGGGGLRAHDYWDNAHEVVPRLADRLRHLVPPLFADGSP
jgi:hypothetical protein